MELPKPPQEIDLRNIIDKLAQFVARNGPEFEQMTKNKQKDNPKFSFLYGGEFFNYYQYKVSAEQSLLKQKSGRENNLQPSMSNVAGGLNQMLLNPSVSNSNSSPSAMSIAAQWLAVTQQVPAPGVTSESIAVHQSQLQEQIRQSEQNLAAQHTVLMQQQQSQIEEAIRNAELELLQLKADDCGICFEDLDSILQPIIESCTKDSISAGKAWILQHSTSSIADYVLAHYLLRKVTNPGAPFTTKLHIIYLVNDVLHHCARKNAEDLKKSLETVVVPMFCNTSLGISEEQHIKLNKLLHLWESKNNYFDPTVIDKLKNPASSWADYQASLIAQHSSEVNAITTTTKQTYDSYQAQHQAFVQHALQQIQSLEQQKQALELQQAQAQAQAQVAQSSTIPTSGGVSLYPDPDLPKAMFPGSTSGESNPQIWDYVSRSDIGVDQFNSVTGLESNIQNAVLQQAIQQQQQQQPQQMSPSMHQPNESPPPPLHPNTHPPPPLLPNLAGPNDIPLDSQNHVGSLMDHHDGMGGMPSGPPHIPPQPLLTNPPECNFNQPPPGYLPITFPPGTEFPDLSKPPPGFPVPFVNNQPPPEHLMIDELLPSVPYFDLPAGLMVPLIKLEDSEYKPLDPSVIRLPPPAPPSERLLAAVEAFYSPPCNDRTRDRIVDSEGWEKLGLYEYYRAKNAAKKKKEEEIADGIRRKSRSPSPIIVKRSRSKSPPKKRYRSKSRSRSRSKSKGRSRSRSRSRTPPPRHYSNNRSMNNRRSPSRRQSRPYRPRSRSRSRTRSKSRSPPYRPQMGKRSPERSPTPPSFLGSTYSKVETQRQIDESNKGHQLLRKMGWSGAGLGAKEQGIEQPISGGEVRDRLDMYKGIGINLNDPYENFRKSKGQAFINRMKARAEERL